MPSRILIVDDDEDFNTLLTDVFTQADYEVISVHDPREALPRCENETFDLVVTDHKMPGMSGPEFVRAVQQRLPSVPVVMVSGYLDNASVRELIQAGVGGVFMKPLNIFSLLKKTAELLEKQADRGGESEGGEEGDSGSLPFPFRALVARDARALAFARRIYEVRDFRSVLLLIGASGSPFRAVVQDLHRLSPLPGERLLVFERETLEDAHLLNRLQRELNQGHERMLLGLLDFDSFSPEQRQLIYQLAKRTGPFTDLAGSYRFVACLHQDVDTLYEQGKLDDSLYIFLGTVEARMPSLKEMPDEIVPLARRHLDQRFPGATLTDEAENWLRQQSWVGELVQLEAVLDAAGEHAHGQNLSVRVLEEAMEGRLGASGGDGQTGSESLPDYLRRIRDAYTRAVFIATQGDRQLAAQVLGVSPDAFNRIEANLKPLSGETS